jgi:hypothetical protein
MSIRIASAVILLAAGSAAAQEASVFDPKAKSPGAAYRSAFEGYRPFAGQQPADWRKANEEVREAAQKPPAAPAAGHGKHPHGEHRK